jgi:hypothetical protein
LSNAFSSSTHCPFIWGLVHYVFWASWELCWVGLCFSLKNHDLHWHSFTCFQVSHLPWSRCVFQSFCFGWWSVKAIYTYNTIFLCSGMYSGIMLKKLRRRLMRTLRGGLLLILVEKIWAPVGVFCCCWAESWIKSNDDVLWDDNWVEVTDFMIGEMEVNPWLMFVITDE